MNVIYVGDSRDVIKRILNNHCNGNVESSTLRRTIAERMGFKIKRTKRKSGSTRIRIDSKNPGLHEKNISNYLKSCCWRILFFNDYKIAHDFQWYLVERLKPPLNKDQKKWIIDRREKYEKLFFDLMKSDCYTYYELKGITGNPGIYVLIGKLMRAYLYAF